MQSVSASQTKQKRKMEIFCKTKFMMKPVFRIRICIKICLLDPDPHGQMRIRIQEVKKPRKCTLSS